MTMPPLTSGRPSRKRRLGSSGALSVMILTCASTAPSLPSSRPALMTTAGWLLFARPDGDSPRTSCGRGNDSKHQPRQREGSHSVLLFAEASSFPGTIRKPPSSGGNGGKDPNAWWNGLASQSDDDEGDNSEISSSDWDLSDDGQSNDNIPNAKTRAAPAAPSPAVDTAPETAEATTKASAGVAISEETLAQTPSELEQSHAQVRTSSQRTEEPTPTRSTTISITAQTQAQTDPQPEPEASISTTPTTTSASALTEPPTQNVTMADDSNKTTAASAAATAKVHTSNILAPEQMQPEAAAAHTVAHEEIAHVGRKTTSAEDTDGVAIASLTPSLQQRSQVVEEKTGDNRMQQQSHGAATNNHHQHAFDELHLQQQQQSATVTRDAATPSKASSFEQDPYRIKEYQQQQILEQQRQRQEARSMLSMHERLSNRQHQLQHSASDVDDASDTDDGLSYTLPNLPIYLSDAEPDSDIEVAASTGVNAHANPKMHPVDKHNHAEVEISNANTTRPDTQDYALPAMPTTNDATTKPSTLDRPTQTLQTYNYPMVQPISPTSVLDEQEHPLHKQPVPQARQTKPQQSQQQALQQQHQQQHYNLPHPMWHPSYYSYHHQPNAYLQNYPPPPELANHHVPYIPPPSQGAVQQPIPNQYPYYAPNYYGPYPFAYGAPSFVPPPPIPGAGQQSPTLPSRAAASIAAGTASLPTKIKLQYPSSQVSRTTSKVPMRLPEAEVWKAQEGRTKAADLEEKPVSRSRLSFVSIQKIAIWFLIVGIFSYSGVSPRNLGFLQYNQQFYENFRICALAMLPPILITAFICDTAENRWDDLVHGFYNSITIGYPLIFMLEILVTTVLRLIILRVMEPSIFQNAQSPPWPLLPWLLREHGYKAKRITLFVADFATSCVACPIIEEYCKLLLFQYSYSMRRNFDVVTRDKTTSSSSSSSSKGRKKLVKSKGSSSATATETPVINVNAYITSMFVTSVGIKMMDAVRRICMYTKAGDANKRFFAICRGFFPIQELCGVATVLSLARRDVLGQDVSVWRMLLPAAIFHGMAIFRGMKPIFKWNASTPWSEMQLSPNMQSDSLRDFAAKAFPKVMWLIILLRVMGYCVKNYFMINRKAVKRTTTYAGKHSAFSAELVAAQVLRESTKK